MNKVTITFRWQAAYWATIIAGAMVLSGFGVILLGWRGTAALLLVPLQVPYVLSAGLAGLALVGLGMAVLNTQAERQLRARERMRLNVAIGEATEILALTYTRSEDSTS